MTVPSDLTSELIFDVGMNNGDDTAHYLSKGYRVVAVEADPVLCSRAHDRFAEAVRSGQLVIENAGIAEESGTATFYVNDEKSEFSAFDPEIAGRNGMKCHSVTVRAVTFDEMLAMHGVPYYLKIDIEHSDRHCLEALKRHRLPKYLSIEAHEVDYLLILWGLGYRWFKVIDQMRHNSTFPLLSNENAFSRIGKLVFWYADRVKNKLGSVRYAPGSSGPFGEDTPGEWQPLDEVAYNWLHLHRGYRNRGNLSPWSWYDFHAKLG